MTLSGGSTPFGRAMSHGNAFDIATSMHWMRIAPAVAIVIVSISCGGLDPEEDEASASVVAQEPVTRPLERGDARLADSLPGAGDGPAAPKRTPMGPTGGRTGPITDEELIAEHPDDIIEPLVGERRLSPDAIEIVPDELIPPHLTQIPEDARDEIITLIEKLQQLDPSLTSDHHDRHYMLAKWRLEKLEKDERKEVGWAALHAFSNFPQRNFQVKRNLLRIGARVAPEAAAPMLEQLSFNYGHNLEDRAEALLLLGEVAPERFFEGARPYLERDGRPFQTAPQDEFFVRGWLNACEESDRSPVPMMSQVAMNFALGPMARYTAVKSLADHGDDPLARAALEAALVESSGDAILRRNAAQSIVAGYSREEACTILERVLDRESDPNFARFLDDMIQQNCR